ncbi:MAG: ABC transporter substrate-binding protein [Dehalococcoidia bacterium]|nr:ABC transporter substrate-binding protein [Dehalococcoidia bacterium]
MIRRQKLGIKIFMLAIGALLILLPFIGCAAEAPAPEEPEPTPAPAPEPALKEPVIFADVGWDSVQVHNRIAAFIVENGYGYPKSEFTPGQTIPLFQGLARGDIDVNMEVWVENQREAYNKAIDAGQVVDLGDNYWDNWQGWLVPTYLVKGDAARGIEASAPDLKSVDDLPKYWELFKDPEDQTKGRFVNSVPGWECTGINTEKLKVYGLDKYYTDFLPGSDAALSGSMVGAYEKGEPWLGYYWEPTWVLGKLDMFRIEESPYDEEIWNTTHACAYPAVHVNIVVHSSFPDRAPELVEFLTKYVTTTEQNNKALAYMQANEASTEEAAIWFLKEYESLWTQWVPADVADKVKAALP